MREGLWKLLCISACIWLTALGANAQGNVVKDYKEEVGACTFEAFYNFLRADTTLRHGEKYAMILQVGPTAAKFLDYNSYYLDSVRWSKGDKMTERAYTPLVRTHTPQKNAYFLTHLDTDSIEEWQQFAHLYAVLKEKAEPIEWNVNYPDTITRQGYKCKYATAKFRGRTWRVWYTEEVPMSVGPWKLHGLPGLIVAAQDDSRRLRFFLQGVRKGGDYPIRKHPVVKQTRFLDAQKLREWRRMETEEFVKFMKLLGIKWETEGPSAELLYAPRKYFPLELE